jgi:hypothetical protein
MAGFVKESYFPIWNAGSSSHDTNSGPGCTSTSFLDPAIGNSLLSRYMDADGGPIATATDLDCESSVPDAAGDLVIRKTGLFTSVLDGTYCYINFADTYTDGYYEIHKIDNDTAKLHPKTATVGIGDVFVAWISNTDADNIIYIGGAFKTQNGFQTADVGGSATQNHMVYTRGNETVTASVVYAKGGERDVNKWTRYIGVDASWVPLTQGNYACIYGNQDSGQAMHDDHLAEITSTTVENLRFENLRFENTGADSADAATAMCFNKGNGSLGGHVFKNCYFKRGYAGYGFTTASAGDTLLNCVAEDCQKYGLYPATYTNITGCYVFSTGNCTILTSSAGIYATIYSQVTNCVVANLVNTTNKEIAIGIIAEGRQRIANNSLYGILTTGIYIVAQTNVIISNNSIHVKTPGTTDALYGVGFSYIELNNITNDTAANCGFLAGSGSVAGLAITATDPWINAAAGDFRLIRTGLALSNVIDCGFVPYCPSSIAGKTSIGAYSVGDMPLVDSVLESDTVMGTAGTYHAALVAEVLDSVAFGPASGLQGTYHAPDAAEVINTAVFGPGSATPGTFDEAARNTDPREENVENGVEYELYGVTMTGSMIPMPPGGGGGGPNVIGSGIIMAVRGRTS